MGEVPRRGGRRWPWVLGIALALLVGGYAGSAWALSGRVPAGVTVAGVDVGGLSQAAALQTLERELAPTLGSPATVRVGTTTDRVDPVQAGMTADLPATVDTLVGFSLNPVSLWRHLQGSDEAPVVTTADDDRLTAVVDALADRVDADVAQGQVTFAGDGTPVPTAAAQGRALDVEGAKTALLEQWPTGGAPIELPADITEPTIGEAAVQEAITTFARPATAGPLVVLVGGLRTEVPPAAVAATLRFEPEGKRLQPVVDGEALKSAVLATNPSVATEPKDAAVALEDGRPVVVPAVNGVTIDAARLAEAAVTALPTPERTATLEATVAEPELTTAEAEALGIKETVSQFATNLTANAARTENIQIASRTVNGTLLMPGETFSLNDKLGRRTPEKGYNQAPVIMSGRLTQDFGGGVSQVATTLFNGMFFAGLEDVAHKPHSFYISRYPEGREATVNYPTVDLKFTNDSQYGVLIEMWTGGGRVHTRFWSTKVWDISAQKGPRTNVKPPKEIVDNSPGCVEQSASPGFDVKVTRLFSTGGDVKKRETFSTRYIPEDKVTCTAQ